MKRTEGWAAVLAGIGLCWPVHTVEGAQPPQAAAPPAVHAEWSEAPTVQELLRLDLEAAMAAARRADGAESRARAPHAPGTQGADAATQAPARLLAIYGVGKRLQAEIEIEGQRHVLRPGASAGGPAGYRLLDVNGACLRAQRGKETPLALCLHPSPPEP